MVTMKGEKRMGKEREWTTQEKEMFEKISGREVLLFGAGEDGERFLASYGNQVNIKGFLDSGVPKGETYFIKEYPVYSYQDVITVRENAIIIVDSGRYANEMVQQLRASGFREETDFLVFAKHYLEFTEASMNEHVERFIQHNERVWKNYLPASGKNKVLILHVRIMSTLFIDLSYFANYIAKENEAQIWTVDQEDAYSCESLERLYRSFNAGNHMIQSISAEQKKEAREVTEEMWPHLLTKKDWLQITLDGVAIGEDIWAYYIRLHESEILTDVHDEMKKMFLNRVLLSAIFWRDFFQRDRSIRAIILNDGLYYEGLIRKFALVHGIKVYSISDEQRILWNHFQPGRRYQYYAQFFDELSEEEQTRGIAWAKEHLAARLQGDTTDIPYMDHSAFEEQAEYHQPLQKNDKLKVVICPHVVWDNPYANGQFLFEDHWEWLDFLGKMTLKTDYDWYLKVHPNAEEPDQILFHKLITVYPKIKILPLSTTGQQLKEGGVRFVLTVWGTLGHEYPAMGIQVINAGSNPHMAFDFNWNPTSKEEYEDWLLHLDALDKKIDMEQVYKFYCIHYLYCFVMDEIDYSFCYESPQLRRKLRTSPGRRETIRFDEFLAEWTPERHQAILERIGKHVRAMNLYRDEVFLGKDGTLRGGR